MHRADYSKFQKAIPELAQKHYDVIIIGYHSCPYSKKAQAALMRVKKWKGKSIFVGYEFGGTEGLKEETGYHGTFPVVFVYDGHKMVHVGGGTDFAELVEKNERQL